MSAVPRRLALPNGLWGAAAFVATEATLFGTLVSTYFYLRFQTTDWPPGGIEPPRLVLPLLLTGVLVATSVPVQLASSSALRARPRTALLFLLLALLVQAGYLGAQVALFGRDLERFTPQDNAYGSIYFTLLGAHHAHVLAGILLSLWLLARLLRGLTRYRVTAVRVVALYWHFVNALAVVVVLTQLSPAL